MKRLKIRSKNILNRAIVIIGLLLPYALSAAPQNPPEDVENYRWLYNIIFSETDRLEQPHESFKSFYVHLLDSDQVFPEPQQILNRNLKWIENIEGLITYVNVIKKKYTYDVFKTDQKELILNVRVHFKDPKNDDIKNFREKLKLAEDIWNASRVKTDFNYSFQFELTESEVNSHFSVSILDSTRGPYDRNWGRNWTATTIAHEMGHMLGLGDEYQTLNGKIDCLTESLMCQSGSGSLMKHHYYFVLRRLVQQGFL